jgi:hypothetical protein
LPTLNTANENGFYLNVEIPMSDRYVKQERSRENQKSGKNKLVKRALNFKKGLPLLLQVFNLVLFFLFIPDAVAEEYSIFFAIVGGVSTLVLSFWIIVALLPKFLEEAPIFAGLTGISTLFIFGITFITQTVNYSSQQLEEFGVVVEATVIDKTRIYGKPPSTAEFMDVQFLSEDNKWQKATIDLSKTEYDRYQRGDKVFIHYSSEHPNIARIAYGRN